MKTFLIILLSVLGFAFVTTKEPLKVDAISSETMINIKLDEGKKWPTDDATTSHIQTMITLCEQALSQKTYEVTALNDALTKEINLLNRNTKMTGDARSQLHNYQLGIRKRIQAISDNRGSVEWLLHELKRYADYFD
tara:strand:- start:12832 stop:13242 length:411 start_codon:yes stop_codon:yes gene_type:complete